MSFSVHIIKPCRMQKNMPILDKTRTLKNAEKFVETSLVLDLNILSKMHEVMTGETKYRESGLLEFVETIKKLPNVYLSPGFAMYEVFADMQRDVCASFESFLSIYAKKFIDAPNATRDFLLEEPVVKKSFADFTEGEQYLCAIPYLSMLKIWLITAKYTDLKPDEKYSTYLDFMATTINIIGAIENEIAKFVFCNSNDIADKNFQRICKTIRENFNKRPNSSNIDRVLKDRLNAARDIAYYRLTALQSNEFLDGKQQDTWLATGDNGIKELSSFIYFVPHSESDSKYITRYRNNLQKNSNYWKYCDAISDLTGIIRMEDNIANKTTDLDKIINAINTAENEINEFLVSGFAK